MIKRPLVVLGTPCGGTTWAWQVLSQRFAVDKERWGRDGIVCGFTAWDLEERPSGTLIQLLRDPFEVVPTLSAAVRDAGPQSRLGRIDYSGTNADRALRYWIETHLRIDDFEPDAVVHAGDVRDMGRAVGQELGDVEERFGSKTPDDDACLSCMYDIRLAADLYKKVDEYSLPP